MSCIHITASQVACPAFSPQVQAFRLNKASPCSSFRVQAFQLNKPSTCLSTFSGERHPTLSLKVTSPASKYQRSGPVCLFGGKGKSDGQNEGSPWNALEKAMGNLKKEPSIEDLLRQQIQKGEFYDDGGSGGNTPGGGGGGGDGSGESENEGFSGIVDEFVQVILATIGFVFLYIFIIEGEEITVLAKDFIKLLFGGQKSIRLRRLIDQWKGFFQSLTEKEEDVPYWLEHEILTTPTWYDSPNKYTRIAKAYMEYKKSYW